MSWANKDLFKVKNWNRENVKLRQFVKLSYNVAECLLITVDIFSVPTDVLIYAEKFKFENPAIMDDKQCK